MCVFGLAGEFPRWFSGGRRDRVECIPGAERWCLFARAYNAQADRRRYR